MEKGLTAVLIIGSICYLIGFIIETLSKNKLRAKVIASGISDERFLNGLFSKTQQLDNRFQSLKWGLILLFSGIGLIALEYIPYDYNSPLPFGIEATAIALGFLVYYFIISAKQKQQ